MNRQQHFDLREEQRLLRQFHSRCRSMKIGVVYGPKSREDSFYIQHCPRESLAVTALLESMHRLGLEAYQVDPTREGFLDALLACDVLFLNMHGEYGEDGRIQGLLDYLERPYTGSGVLASALGLNKVLFKQVLIGTGVLTPRFLIPSPHQGGISQQLEQLGIPLPVMVKPVSGGSSIGMVKVTDPEDLSRFDAAFVADSEEPMFVEEFIAGPAVTVGVLETSQGIVALPIIEIETGASFYDEQSKLSVASQGAVRYHVPARLAEDMTQQIHATACQVHLGIGCRGFSRVDFVVDTEKKQAFVLEINTIPGISMNGNFIAGALAFGFSYDEIVLSVLRTALG